MTEPEMTDSQVAGHIREWVRSRNGFGGFSWPTDGCGYAQHMKFVEHRNRNFTSDYPHDFRQFCLDYADSLEGI